MNTSVNSLPDDSDSLKQLVAEQQSALIYKEKRIINETFEAKRRIRQETAVPIWQGFIAWATHVKQQGVVNAKTRQALNYLLTHELLVCRHPSRCALQRYASSACLNRQRRIITTRCTYLTALLADLPISESVDDIEALLPWNLNPEAASLRYHALP